MGLRNESLLLGSYKKQILAKAQELYERQKETNIVKSCYVTFNKVEKAYNDKYENKFHTIEFMSAEADMGCKFDKDAAK